MKADRILVINGGEIIEDGSHYDLLKLKGKYYDMWSKQTAVLQSGSEESGSKVPCVLNLEADDWEDIDLIDLGGKETGSVTPLTLTDHANIEDHGAVPERHESKVSQPEETLPKS